MSDIKRYVAGNVYEFSDHGDYILFADHRQVLAALVNFVERYYESLLHRTPGMWDAFEQIENAIAAVTGESPVDVNKRLMASYRSKTAKVMAEAKDGREQIATLKALVRDMRALVNAGPNNPIWGRIAAVLAEPAGPVPGEGKPCATP